MPVIRHSKVDIPVNGVGAYAFVVQPDDDASHPGLVLIQEWWGIEPHILELANTFALAGFVVAVPDLYHGKVATEPDDATKMVMMMRKNVDRAAKEIMGTLDFLKTLPNVEPKKLGLIGFCVGGFLAYTVAARYKDLAAVVPFYAGGYDPSPDEVANVNVPVMAIYGNQDQSIPQTQVKKIEKMYKDAGKDITVHVYDAGHAFVNPDHGMGDEKSARDALQKAIAFLKKEIHQ